MKKRVLFLYLTKWSGHSAAAQALRAALEEKYPGVVCEESDFVSDAFPGLTATFKKAYVGVMKHFPTIWNYVYDNEYIETITKEFRVLFDAVHSGWLRDKVRKAGADIIVCTQAVPCEILAREKQDRKLSVPLIAVPTDFIVHAYWPSAGVDHYLLPAEETVRAIIARGVPKSAVTVTGIPVHPDFLKSVSKGKARESLRLRSRVPTLLCIGGSYGFGAFSQALEEIARAEKQWQVFMVTSRNVELYEFLKTRWAKHPNFRIIGFAKNIPLLMDAADILVGKPGGATTAEALAKGLPIAIFNPFPGQESRNAEYLLRHKAAIVISDVAELVPKIGNLFSAPGRLASLRSRAKQLGRPRSAFSGADTIMKVLREKIGKTQ